MSAAADLYRERASRKVLSYSHRLAAFHCFCGKEYEAKPLDVTQCTCGRRWMREPDDEVIDKAMALDAQKEDDDAND